MVEYVWWNFSAEARRFGKNSTKHIMTTIQRRIYNEKQYASLSHAAYGLEHMEYVQLEYQRRPYNFKRR